MRSPASPLRSSPRGAEGRERGRRSLDRKERAEEEGVKYSNRKRRERKKDKKSLFTRFYDGVKRVLEDSRAVGGRGRSRSRSRSGGGGGGGSGALGTR